MQNWTVEKIKEFYAYLNDYFGLSVNPTIETGKADMNPLIWHNGKLIFIPDFFNDDELEDDVRKFILVLWYSAVYYLRNDNMDIDMHPVFLAKGICDELGFRVLSSADLEKSLRRIRRKLHQDVALCCCYKVGDECCEDSRTEYRVVKVERTQDDVLITVKPIGFNSGDQEMVFTEEELFNRCHDKEKNINDVKVDMRKNITIIAKSYDTEITSVLQELFKKHPEIKKIVPVTTRPPKDDEVDGKDYYFISEDTFLEHSRNFSIAEYNLHKLGHYGILHSEAEKYTDEEPLIIVIDALDRCQMLRHFPLSKTVFIQPLTHDEINERFASYFRLSRHEFQKRFDITSQELENQKYFDSVITEKDTKKCADALAAIILN